MPIKRASASLEKARALHKAHLGNAAGDGFSRPSKTYPAAQVSGHMIDALEHLSSAMQDHARALEHHGTTRDLHEVADTHLSKATRGWVPASENRARFGAESGHPGIYEVDPGIRRLSDDERTEGPVDDGDPSHPYSHSGKAAVIDHTRSVLEKEIGKEAPAATVAAAREGKSGPVIERTKIARYLGKMSINRLGGRTDLPGGFSHDLN